jgi:hypothetical protein
MTLSFAYHLERSPMDSLHVDDAYTTKASLCRYKYSILPAGASTFTVV